MVAPRVIAPNTIPHPDRTQPTPQPNETQANMSDTSENPLHDAWRINKASLIDYFSNAFTDVTCEICKTSHWLFALEDGPANYIFADQWIATHDGGVGSVFDKAETGYPLIMMVCEKCGNTKLFMAHTVLQNMRKGGYIKDAT